MDTQVYMQALEHKEEYKSAHIRSWESDLEIARLLQQGMGCAKIAQTISCSKASVYRALDRLRGFSQFHILKDKAMSDPPHFGGDANSVLEMLFNQYKDNNNFDNEKIKESFRSLYQQMEGKKQEEIDPMICTAGILCREYEKSGFVEGVKVGGASRRGNFYLRRQKILKQYIVIWHDTAAAANALDSAISTASPGGGSVRIPIAGLQGGFKKNNTNEMPSFWMAFSIAITRKINYNNTIIKVIGTIWQGGCL